MSRGIQGGAMTPVVLLGSNGITLPVDRESNVLVMVDIVHWRIHRGEMFTASYITPNAAPIADDATVAMLLETDSTTPHLIFDVEGGGDFEAQFYEGTTTSNDGTTVTPYNMNRNSSTVQTLVTTHTPTVTDNGTQLFTHFYPGGSGGHAIGGGGFTLREWILKASTKYLILLTNRAGTAQPMGVSVQWYEVA